MLPGFDIGPIRVQYYGIILMLGALAGAWLTAYEAKRRGQDSEIVWDGLIWVIIGGIIGARIWHILTPPPSMVERGITTAFYLTHPLDAINIRMGGLGIPGAVIGGLLALYWYARRKKQSFLFWADIAAPGLALGQAIGRWGNFVNQELYGLPTYLPWGIHIDPQYRMPGFESIEYYHPVFLYESLWSLGNMGFLLWISRRFEDRLKPGDVFLTYMVIYPLGRFLIEFLRLDSAQIAGINANQTLMLVVALAAGGTLIWRHRFKSSLIQEPAAADEEPQEMSEAPVTEAQELEGELSNEGGSPDEEPQIALEAPDLTSQETEGEISNDEQPSNEATSIE